MEDAPVQMDEKPQEQMSRSASKDKVTEEPQNRSRSRERQFHDTSKQVYVRGLDRDTTETDLQDKFGEFGKIVSIDIKHNRYAFVDFETESAVDRAVEKMDGSKFVNGEVLNVQKSSKFPLDLTFNRA